MVSVETGKVIEIKKDIAVIALKGEASCAACGHCDENVPAKDLIVNVPLDRPTYTEKAVTVKPGDTVRLECETPGQAKTGFLYFILPILLAIAGFAIGTPLFEQTGFSSYQALGGGLAGGLFAIPYIVLVLIHRARKRSGNNWIKIVDVPQSGGAAEPKATQTCCS